VDPRVGLDARKRYVHKGWARIHLALSRWPTISTVLWTNMKIPTPVRSLVTVLTAMFCLP
jgi:hypothetical protein